MYLRIQILCGLLAGLILATAACAPAGAGIPVTGETPSPGTPTGFPDLPPKAVLDAQRWLATQLSTTVEKVRIIDVEQAEWTDSCLGLGRANESCLQVVTPGWMAIFEIDGQPYEVRTDETGSTIRLASPKNALREGATLENTNWQLVSFGLRGAAKPLVEESTVTLVLDRGNVGGSGGCNAYGGTYQVEGGNISFDEITSTLRACTDERVTDQEQRYLAALQAADRYELDGNNLHIFYDDGSGVLVFETSLPAGPAGPLPVIDTATPGG